MMKNILLPTDFSDNARNAAAYALQFFQNVPCTFHLLHVIPVPAGQIGSNYLTTSPTVQKEFDELLGWLESIKVNPEHHFSIAFKGNFFIEAVRSQVIEKNIDLILMGTKGATNKAGTMIGKNTSDVITKVKCPVLAISEKTLYNRAQEILFPTDYKIPYEAKMLKTLQNVVNLSQASVMVLELFNGDGEPTGEQLNNKTMLQNFFAPKIPDSQPYYPSREKDPNLFGNSKNPDMIVMAAKNLNVCHKLLGNHQSSQIPFINQLPLLILH